MPLADEPVDSFTFFFKEASIRPNNNHVILPSPLQADLFCSDELQIGVFGLINFNNKAIAGVRADNRKPSETKQRVRLFISTSSPALPQRLTLSPADASVWPPAAEDSRRL